MVRVNAWMMNAGICVPGWLHVRPDVSPGAKLLYSVLAEEAQGEEGVFSKDTEHFLGEDAFGFFQQLVNHELLEVEGEIDESAPISFSFLLHPWMDNRIAGDEE
jgi:hypothetical protein